MILAMIMTLENEEERSFVEELYYEYGDKMMNLCMAILKNVDDAQDAVSDAFVCVMNSVEKFMDADNLEGFLMVTTKNAACDLYKRKSRQLQNETSSTYYDDNDDEGVQLDIKDESVNIEQALLDKEFISEVKELLKSMPEDMSTIVVYKYLYHFGNTEIAEMLGVDRSVINLKLFRARKKLQKLLSDHYLKV